MFIRRHFLLPIASLLWVNFTLSVIAQTPPAATEFIQLLASPAEGQDAYNHVLRAYSAIPPQTAQQMKDAGLRIVIVPSLVEYRPELVGKQPPGYEEGQDYSHMDAQYRGKANEVVVAVKVARTSEGMVTNNRVGSATLHELGHAYDKWAGFPSRSEEFMSAYQQDVAKLDATQREKDHYYLQPGRNGPRELFAELFLYCYHSKAGLNVRHPRLPTDFPNCAAYMNNLADQLR